MGSQLKDALKMAGFVVKKNEQPKKKLIQFTDQKNNSDALKESDRVRSKNKISNSLEMSDGRSARAQAKHKMIQNRLRADLKAVMVDMPVKEVKKPKEKVICAKQPPATLSVPDFQLKKISEFHTHPLFQIQDQQIKNVTTVGGIDRQLSTSPEDETDLILGLDFGTSSTKMVIRDAFTSFVFPVVVKPSGMGLERFLSVSCVFLNEGMFSLSGPGVRLDNLKLSLLSAKASYPVTEFNHCCAYLALMIRLARGWFLFKHEAIYKNHKLNWYVNIGLAASSYQDEDKVQLFRRLAWAAANLASDKDYPEITQDAVDKYRQLSRNLIDQASTHELAEIEFLPSNVGVIPEVAAQIQGFMNSSRWDWKNRPIMMLVDVGAGTVDAALFHVNSTDKKLTFYSSRVEPNGAMNLHRDRVLWLSNGVPNESEFSLVHDYLKLIANSTGRLLPIPNDVTDYLPGYSIVKIKCNVDDTFRIQKYRTQVAGSINEAKIRKGLGANGSHQLLGIPLLLCGGGSRLPIYSTIAGEINRTPGWNVSVEKIAMPVPIELRDSGFQSEEFDRISVAYGLSLQQGLEKIVRAIDVPDVVRVVKADATDRYVSKDDC
jgi:hypothetical protein